MMLQVSVILYATVVLYATVIVYGTMSLYARKRKNVKEKGEYEGEKGGRGEGTPEQGGRGVKLGGNKRTTIASQR